MIVISVGYRKAPENKFPAAHVTFFKLGVIFFDTFATNPCRRTPTSRWHSMCVDSPRCGKQGALHRAHVSDVSVVNSKN